MIPTTAARWDIAEQHFCSKPNFRDSTPLQVRDPDGLKELSFVFFAGWLFCGILNREKELVRPCLLPMGKSGEFLPPCPLSPEDPTGGTCPART